MRYEPADECPAPQAIANALLIFVPNTASIILLIAFVVRSSGQSDSYLAWATFTGLLISGLSMILQAMPFRYLGSGGLVVTNLNVPLLAMSVLALAKGGPGLLASLVIATTALQFAVVPKLASLRRVFTPTVSGIIIMLVAVSAVPFIVNQSISDSQDQTAYVFIPGLIALIAGLWAAVQASPARRVWTLPVAVVAGLLVAFPMGLYDFALVAEAPWLSFTDLSWPGWGLDFGVNFWSLLPAFLVVKLTAFLKVVGDLSVIGRASYSDPVAVDFRKVQSGLNVYGLTTILTGLLATPPVSAPWSSTAVYIGFTRNAARTVGIYLGAMTILIALFSKVVAAIAATPNSVISAVYVFVFGLLFIEGAKWVFNGPMSNRKSVITGVSLVLGLSAGTFGQISEGVISELLGNTVIVGAITAIGMTAITDFPSLFSRKLRLDLSPAALPDIARMLDQFAERHSWNEGARTRLNLVVEEAVLTLLEQSGESESSNGRRLVASVRYDAEAAEVELVVFSNDQLDGNIEDQLAYLSDSATSDVAEHLSTRLLQHFASSVHHRKYHGVEVITCRVEK